MLEKMEARRKNANFKIEIVAAPLNHSTIYDSTIQRFNDSTIYERPHLSSQSA